MDSCQLSFTSHLQLLKIKKLYKAEPKVGLKFTVIEFLVVATHYY